MNKKKEDYFLYLLQQCRINYSSKKMKITLDLFGYGQDNFKNLVDIILELQRKGKEIYYTEYVELKKFMDKLNLGSEKEE